MTEGATEPEELARLLVARINAGDVDGVVALYEAEAVLALTSSRLPGGGATAEVARRQADGTWGWVLDSRTS